MNAENNEKNLPVLRPATDILERADGYWVYMDMPGVGRDDLVLDLREAELAVSGKTRGLPAEKERFLEVQFGSGEFRQTIALSDIVDRAGIKATLKNGVLEIFMPKVAKVQPRRIDIQAG
ncbi:Hsp20/alpha crystallin family protein [Desulfovibrio aminophilus]|nr:Hsp20/alpha crystallin family protein [Desulfovibrio aminophilus]MCM0753851.1 Hsp20/alpha crystallin family protein [Desulfovibrio aminophilus]